MKSIFLKTIFHSNGFPSDTFYKYVRLFLTKIFHPTPVIPTVKKHTIYVSFPYFGYLRYTEKRDSNMCGTSISPDRLKTSI